jgi:carbon-monoxide dehydrogenase small subunit
VKHSVVLTVNGEEYVLAIDPHRTLAEVLREELRLTGTKIGCGTGDCGACTVLLDGRAVSSCLTLAVEADGRRVVTVEGLAPSGEQLHPIQQAFIEKGAIQCGFCTPGMEMSTLALLQGNPHPTEEEIRAGLAGNLCRCTGYNKIVEAVATAAGAMAEEPMNTAADGASDGDQGRPCALWPPVG